MRETLQALAGMGHMEQEEMVRRLEDYRLESLHRDRAALYFPEILRRIRVVDHEQLGLLLDDALDAGRISREERGEILWADVVVEGKTYDGREVYLLAEVSVTVAADDIRRARTRAQLLEKATGRPVLPAVAGRELARDPETLREAATVWCLLDGKTAAPGPA